MTADDNSFVDDFTCIRTGERFAGTKRTQLYHGGSDGNVAATYFESVRCHKLTSSVAHILKILEADFKSNTA